MNTVEQVNQQAKRIADLIENDENITMGTIYRALRDSGHPVRPTDFLSVYLVGIGSAIPEVVTEACYPSVERLRFFGVDLQKKHLKQGKPFRLVVENEIGEYVTEKRTFKELNDSECEQLFACESAILHGRALVEHFEKLDADMTA